MADEEEMKATKPEKEEQQKERIADKLIKIAIEKSYRDSDSRPNAGGLFHTPDSIAYADIETSGWRETWPIRSRGFRHWLVRIYYQVTGMAPNSEALQTALGLCEARAHYDGPKREVCTRVGGSSGKIYIDLANEHWQAIEVSSTGWKVLDSKQVPVRFRRAPGMLALPHPKPSGDGIETLRTFLNVKSDADFELALAWLLAAMRDRGPYPVLTLMGEQGSAKTSFATILRSLVDPNTAPLRSFPREDRDLFIAASNGWVVGYDNVSRIPSWLSDALCRLATGGGFSTRKLYTDDEEQLFNAQRPTVLNGIEDFVDRPDLADRTVFLTLEPIPEDQRKADQALQDEFNRARPQILGALLNLVVVGLQRLPRTKLDRLPRMADFALWGAACEREPGAFMKAYEVNRKELAEGVLDADAIASAIRKLMAARTEWRGTASQLLHVLEEIAGERTARSKNWPGSAEALGRGLRRPATFLRKVGIDINRERDPHSKERTRLIKITRRHLPDREGKEPSEPSDRPKENKTNGLGSDTCSDSCWEGAELSEEPSEENTNEINASDGSDSSDSNFPTNSNGGRTCAQCNADVEPLVQVEGIDPPVYLHPECRRFWFKDHTEARLRRAPALGPAGDAMDDFK
jgi:hypothetical protein